MSRRTALSVLAAGAVAASLVLSGCTSSSSTNPLPVTGSVPTAGTTPGSTPGTTSRSTSGSTPGTTPGRPLRILVTNDDGVGAAGIDAVVEGLRALPDTEVVVVAPAANQSGTGGKTTGGTLTAASATTASGYRATAVTGFPADSVVWAIDQGGVTDRPDLVVSGINIGQNIGPLSEISGTVGAARAAAARGIPALASSQGLGDPLDFPSGVKLVTEWVTSHRAALLAGTPTGTTPGAATVVSINIPTCPAGTLRALVEVPTATDAAGRDVSKSDCTTPSSSPKDDIDAFIHGYPSLSTLGQAPG